MRSSTWCLRRSCWEARALEEEDLLTRGKGSSKDCVTHGEKTGGEKRETSERLTLSPREALSRYEIISILIG